MNILILEDNKNKRDNILQILDRVNISLIKSAENFSDFIKWLNRDKYDLIVADIMVPRFNDDKEHTDITK